MLIVSTIVTPYNKPIIFDFFKVALSFPINTFPIKKKKPKIYYNKLFLWRSLCCVWTNNKTTLDCLLSNCTQVLTYFMTNPIIYYFWRFLYMITMLWNLVQLSIYYTMAFFHKYVVAMKYRWICQFLFLSESPPLMYKHFLCICIIYKMPQHLIEHITLYNHNYKRNH